MPPLLLLPNEEVYRAHFRDTLVRNEITTFHGVPVTFRNENFSHAFFESTRRDRNKDAFSSVRAMHMDWIKPTLEDQVTDWYQGYLKKYSVYVPTRSVSIAYDNFVVILKYKTSSVGLSAEFITCYVANKYNIRKIRTSPLWNVDICQTAFKKFGR